MKAKNMPNNIEVINDSYKRLIKLIVQLLNIILNNE